MTDQELKDIVAAVVAELEKSGVDFDYKIEAPLDTDTIFVIRGTAPDYQGVTVTWKGLLDIITAQATQAKTDAETAKNAANAILTQVQSKGTEITNFVATSKTEIETQKNESVNAVKSVYQTDLNELKGDLVNVEDVIGLPKFEWVLGKINPDGTTYDIYKNYVRSDNYIDFTNKPSIIITIPSGFQAQLFWYSSDKSTVQSEYKVNGINVVTPKDGKPLLRLQIIKLNHSGSADMSWLNGFSFSFFDLVKTTDIETELKTPGKVADSKAVGDRFDSVESRVSEAESVFGIANIVFTTGLINASTGAYTRPYDQRLLSEFITFDNYDVLQVTIPTGYQILVGWYDSDGNSITTEKSTEYKVAGKHTISLKNGSSKVLFNIINLSSTSADMSWLEGFEFRWGRVLLDTEIEKLISEKSSLGNVLYGKKYVACGDSFTEGDFSGYVDSEGKSGTNSDYLYDKTLKMYKTYPYWIAQRNGMTLVNEAKCGSTMSTGENGGNIQNRKPFSHQRYKDIPNDADYITLWFGLNDINNSPKGTIDDTTNETFYGAWNVVLEYLITNHPYAKIGIIVTDAYDTFNDAVRNISEKWGIPMLDLMGDKNVPLMMGRKDGINLDSRADELRRNAFMVSATNFHPNLEAHKYQSTFIENFLRSL